MNYFGLTDIGTFREKNQDAFYCGTNSNNDHIALVCDGVGGSKAGEVASKKAVEFIERKFSEAPEFTKTEELCDFAKKMVLGANDFVFSESRKDFEYYGMATTLTGIIVTGIGTVLFNVGDSRVYGYKNHELIQLSEDDTLVNEMIKAGQITYEESLVHPKRHYLIKALGSVNEIEPSISFLDKFESYLICSDGLYGSLDEETMREKLAENAAVKEKCSNLLSLALLNGGYDNITVVILEND